MNEIVIENKIKCHHCEDTIQSYSVHDYKKCSCGKCAVDGGTHYLHHTGWPEDYEDLSVVCNTPEEFEEHMGKITWGTYGKDGKQPLKFVKLIDCETDHLLAILENARPDYSRRKAIFITLNKRDKTPEDIERHKKMHEKWNEEGSWPY
jgi:hypothetical protein